MAEVAFNYMDENTKKEVLKYLDGMTIQEAANWMDNVKSDHSYDFMRAYHYVNFEKGDNVVETEGDNIILPTKRHHQRSTKEKELYERRNQHHNQNPVSFNRRLTPTPFT